jgi:patatin-like phospholipase/acyl hydrolase
MLILWTSESQKRHINTRFIVDILSGTSAGGINAIYLAKALANDQNLDELKTLWVTEGDIALLMNEQTISRWPTSQESISTTVATK